MIFEGKESPLWEPIGLAGGDFAKFARYEKGLLAIDVPAGRSWSKTGLVSAAPALQVAPYGETAPYRFIIRTDPERTSGFVVAFTAERGQTCGLPTSPGSA